MIRNLLLSSLFWSIAGVAQLHGQTAARGNAPQLEVIVRNGADRDVRAVSLHGVVPLVLVRPNQAVPVTLQFPADKAGMRVAATPLDGGTTNRDDLVILPTGKVIFTFKPGTTPGRYRLEVQTSVERHLLEFYVVDSKNPPQHRRN